MSHDLAFVIAQLNRRRPGALKTIGSAADTGIRTYWDGSTESVDPYSMAKWKAEAEDPEAAVRIYNLPRFAACGIHTGGMRIVGENGPEAKFTGPSHIMNTQQMRELFAGGGSADVVAAIEALQRQTYDVGRAQAVLLQSIDQMARKADAIGVLQREGHFSSAMHLVLVTRQRRHLRIRTGWILLSGAELLSPKKCSRNPLCQHPVIEYRTVISLQSTALVRRDG